MTKNLIALSALFILSLGSAKASEIVLGSAPNLQTVPILVAEAKGYLKKKASKLNWSNLCRPTSPEALIGGQLDIFMADNLLPSHLCASENFSMISTLSRYLANTLTPRAHLDLKL